MLFFQKTRILFPAPASRDSLPPVIQTGPGDLKPVCLHRHLHLDRHTDRHIFTNRFKSYENRYLAWGLNFILTPAHCYDPLLRTAPLQIDYALNVVLKLGSLKKLLPSKISYPKCSLLPTLLI